MSLGPEAQDRHAFCPDSFLRVERSPCPTHSPCLLSSQASISPHRERVTLVLPPASCSCHGRLFCFPSISRPQGQRLLLFSLGGMMRLPHTWLLSQAKGMLGQRVFRSMRVSSTELRILAQTSSSSIHKPNSDFPRNAVLSHGRCPGKAAFLVYGFPQCETGQVAKELLSPWALRFRTGMLSAQTPS